MTCQQLGEQILTCVTYNDVLEEVVEGIHMCFDYYMLLN